MIYKSIKLFLISFFLLCLAKWNPGFAEWYSNKIYPVIVNVIGRLFSVAPYSLAEICLYIMLTVVFLSVLGFIIRLIRKRAVWKDGLRGVQKLLHGAAFLLLLYTLGCGINYHRISFSELSGIKTDIYSSKELAILCKKLTADVNQLGIAVKRNKEGISQNDPGIQQEAIDAMEELGTSYEALKGYYPKPKKLLIPELLSIQGLSGIYSPFTVEANYNNAMTPYNIPFTAAHELSHLRGFMQEEEANFIAYLACKSSDSPSFQYSGSLMAWVYSMNVLQKVDQQSYASIRETLNPEILIDLKANNNYWEGFDGQIAETANKVNDTYLKANGQHDGVKSYDRMVDLLVAYELNGNKELVEK